MWPPNEISKRQGQFDDLEEEDHVWKSWTTQRVRGTDDTLEFVAIKCLSFPKQWSLFLVPKFLPSSQSHLKGRWIFVHSLYIDGEAIFSKICHGSIRQHPSTRDSILWWVRGSMVEQSFETSRWHAQIKYNPVALLKFLLKILSFLFLKCFHQIDM